MRTAAVILVLAAIAVTLVHIRRRQMTFAHQIQRLGARQVDLRRRLWDQQVRLGQLTSVERINTRVEALDDGMMADHWQLPAED